MTARFVAALADLLDRSRRNELPARVAHGHADDTSLVSVIVPVRNVAETIDDQLASLAHQSYSGRFEVVVVDNGSTDATRERVERWRDELPELTVVDAFSRKGVAHARNAGLRAARGDLLLICDGDDVVAPDWLEHMVGALSDHPIVTGFIDIVTMNHEDQYAWTGDAAAAEIPIGYGYLPYAPGGNIAMWREVFDLLAGFDETLLRAEDIDFSWRAAYLGFKPHFEPRVVLYRRLRNSPRSELRTAIRGGIAEARLFRSHRQRGMPRASVTDAATMYRSLLTTLPDALAGRTNRHHWAQHAGKRLGRMIGSVRNRVVYL